MSGFSAYQEAFLLHHQQDRAENWDWTAYSRPLRAEDFSEQWGLTDLTRWDAAGFLYLDCWPAQIDINGRFATDMFVFWVSPDRERFSEQWVDLCRHPDVGIPPEFIYGAYYRRLMKCLDRGMELGRIAHNQSLSTQ